MKHDILAVRGFGHLSDGAPVHAIMLAAPSGMRAELPTYGGILCRLQMLAQGNQALSRSTISNPKLVTAGIF